MKNAFEYEAELTALREELVNLQEAVNSAAIDIAAGVEIAKVPGIIAGRLTVAEQRNADMLNWLRRQANAEKDPTVRATFIEAHNALKQISKGEHK